MNTPGNIPTPLVNNTINSIPNNLQANMVNPTYVNTSSSNQ